MYLQCNNYGVSLTLLFIADLNDRVPQRRPDVTADSTTHTNGSMLSPVEQLSQSTGSGSAASQSSIMKFFRNISGPPPPPGPPPHGDGSNLRPKKQKKRPVSKYVNLNSYATQKN